MSDEALPRVLCVDDEPNILAGLERSLFGRFEVVTTNGGEAGLAAIALGEPFDVVVSDMRMPQMDGATFLAKAREVAPDTIRILLTGHADTDSAIAAVNQGAIFRYLCKPCPKEQLVAILDEAVSQHRLVRAEKDLLQNTLTAVVKILTDVLAMVAPTAFQRAAFVQSCVRHALIKLDWPDQWIYTLAASLSQIGCVGIPADVVQADAAQRGMTPDERKLMDGHPEVACRLIEAIPRMGLVAQIVRYQAGNPPLDAQIEIARGAPLLRAALALERHHTRNRIMDQPYQILRELRPALPEYIAKSLGDFRANISSNRAVKVGDLMPGWLVDEDVTCTNGVMVLSKGHELSEMAIATLRRLLAAHAIREPIRVRRL
jgi:CheY-like chemotaxis protein